jgi:hypothetical protein
MWKALWAKEVSDPLKMLTWRACHNILPTRLNLFKWEILEDAKCPCCGVEEESLINAFWTCLAAQDVWGSKTPPFQKCSGIGLNLREYLKIVYNVSARRV